MKVPLTVEETAKVRAAARKAFAKAADGAGAETKVASAAKAAEAGGAAKAGDNIASTASAAPSKVSDAVSESTSATRPASTAEKTAAKAEAAASEATAARDGETAAAAVKEPAVARAEGPKPASVATLSRPLTQTEIASYSKNYKRYFPNGVDQKSGILLRQAEAKFSPEQLTKELEDARFKCMK
jgi:hypothetical protein